MEDLNFGSAAFKMSPNNTEMEEAILGGILFDPEAIIRVSDLLVADAFYVRIHKEIYRAALKLYTQGKPTDVMTVANWLAENDLLIHVGGRSKLVSLVDCVVSTINIDILAQSVMKKYQRRQLIKASHEIYEIAHDETKELEQQLLSAESKLYAIRNNAIKSESEPSSIAEILVDKFEEIEGKNNGLIPQGIPTGFHDLDVLIGGGIKPGKLVTIAGRPGMGKSSIVGNMAHYIAKELGKAVLIFSLEMSKDDYIERLLSIEAKIENTYLTSGRLSNNQWSDLATAISTLSSVPIYVDDSPFLTVSKVRSKAKKLIAERGELAMIAIDYLQLMEGVDASSDNQGNFALQIGKITRQLKQLARECNTTVIILSQLNRGVEGRTNKRPELSDLRESGRIEEDSDMVLMLYRDEYYHPDSPERGLAEVRIAKNRAGPTGLIKLLFDSQFTQFKNFARPMI
jgi:replicative DNA helicase